MKVIITGQDWEGRSHRGPVVDEKLKQGIELIIEQPPYPESILLSAGMEVYVVSLMRLADEISRG
jgi:hypothetical protein